MFKTECTKQINMLNKTPGCKIFQRNYYEHIIRNEEEYIKIKEYIQSNPLMWPARQRLSVAMAGGERDRNNPKNIL